MYIKVWSLTFSSDLRKPGLVPGESLSPATIFGSVLEKNWIYMIINQLAQFLNGKNTNNMVNRWSLEFATYNITFEWISGAQNKVADYLSWLVKPNSTPTCVNILTASHSHGPVLMPKVVHKMASPSAMPTPHPDISPRMSQEATPTPKPLTVDRLDALLQMQRTDPFCKCISKHLLNGKAPHYEFGFFCSHERALI